MKKFLRRPNYLAVLLIVIIIANCIIFMNASNQVKASGFTTEDTVKHAKVRVEVSTQKMVKIDQIHDHTFIINDLTKNYLPDFVIMPYVECRIQNDKSIQENYDVYPEYKVNFVVSENAYVKLESNSRFIFDEHTVLHIKKRGILELSDSSLLLFTSKGQLLLDSGARLFIRDSGKIILDNKSELNVNLFSYIVLKNRESAIYIINGSRISNYKDYLVEYNGDGSIYIDNVNYRNLYKSN